MIIALTLVKLEEDWEWKDISDVFDNVHGAELLSVEMLKRDYAATMMAMKGELINTRSQESKKLSAVIRALRELNGLQRLP